MRTNLYLLAGEQMLSTQEKQFENEDELQLLIAQNPRLLLRNPSNEAEKLFLIQREFAIQQLPDGSSGLSLDHLFIDQDGVPVLVEVKRSTDTRIRREVVGQMLDYASRLKLCSVEDLQKSASDDTIPESIWSKVEENLKVEHFKLIFAADHIPDSLSVIMDFLSRHFSNIEIYGVEICQHRTKSENTLITTNIIESDRAIEQRVRSSQSPWTEEKVIQELEQHGAPQSAQLLAALHSFLKQHGFTLEFAPFSQNGLVHVFKNSNKICGITSWEISSQPTLRTYIEFPIKSLSQKMGITKDELISLLFGITNQVPGGDTYRKINLADLADESVMKKFQDFLLSVGEKLS